MNAMRLVVIPALCVAAAAQGQDVPLRLGLPGGRTVALTVAQLRALPSDTVRHTPHEGSARLYRAVALGDVLRAVGLPLDSLRVGRAAWTIIAEARDGYIVAFTAAEADPRLGPTRVWVAFELGGGPLGEAEGPFRLIVPTDARGARSAHQVTDIRVVDAARR
jgi:hypothetical protein